MLEKRLELGGLQVGASRAVPNTARFRVAHNCYQTKDNYYVPKFPTKLESTLPGDVFAISEYKNKIYKLVKSGSNLLPYYDGVAQTNVVDVPMPVGSKGIQFYEKQGCLYFHIPGKGLWKFDGESTFRAGAPRVYAYIQAVHTSEYSEGYARFITTQLDGQGNAIVSGYVDYESKFRYKSTDMSLRVSVTNHVQKDGTENLLPENGFPAYAIRGISSVTRDPVSKTAEVAASTIKVRDGAKLFQQAGFGTTIGGVSYSMILFSYKVISHSAGAAILGEARVLTKEFGWIDWPEDEFPVWLTTYGNLSTYFLSIFTSDTPTGAYVYKGTVTTYIPSSGAVLSEFSFDGNVTTPFSPINAQTYGLSPLLGDTYDVTSSKQVFPMEDSTSLAVFAGSAYISYGHEIYHSDFTQGGNFEMTEGLGFIVVGDEDEGDVQAVCGTERFLFVSRKYKNFYVSGNIPTANYDVKELANTSIGCLTNESVIDYDSSVIFMNKSGVWLVEEGARCSELSKAIRGFFADFSGRPQFEEEKHFDTRNFPVSVSESSSDLWMKARSDNYRNLIAFVIRGATGSGQILILNMNNGEFHTWDEVGANLMDFSFFEGGYYSAAGVELLKEDKTVTSFTSERPKLVLTWISTGEPSLDKKLTQLKMWGLISGEVEVTQFVDWKDTETHKGLYTNDDADRFSHKFRLNSTNCLAGSIGLEFKKPFYLEGLEVEFSVMQEGMKK